MKNVLIGLAAIALGAGSASAATLHDNGAVVDSQALSILTAPAGALGFNAGSGFSLADDFTVGGAGWNVSSLDFYAYQTLAGGFTLTSATWSVISGPDVNSGTVVASGTSTLTNAGLIGYRVTDTTTGNRDRAIYQVNADVTDFTLAAGSYYLTWSLTGTSSSGPFVPPVLGSLGSGNALQAFPGGTFAAIADSGNGQSIDLPFRVNGTAITSAVPEPASWALLIGGFGVVGHASRRRAKAGVARLA